jgi:hypothetical protein
MNLLLPSQVVATLAKRVYRMHLFLWDELREYWLGYPESVRQKISALGWEPPRPSADANATEITSNNSGEDYLYLHCELIAFANHLLAAAGDPDHPRVEGWVTIPAPDDPDYPIPQAWFVPQGLAVSNAFIARSKTDDFFERRLKHWERMCTDPAFLRKVSLGEFGTLIESTLHDGLRSRWASAPGAWRPDPPIAGEPIATGWDDPQYDYLRDPYAMHVNPIYWKFFGWVQDRVEDWKITNGVFGRDFWKATWVGKMPGERKPSGRCPPGPRDTSPLFATFEDAEIAGPHVEEMEKVISIIAEGEATT